MAFGLSILLGLSATVFVFFPKYRKEFLKPSIEWPVLTPEQALEKYFGVF